MMKKTVSVLLSAALLGTMVLGTAVTAQAGTADGMKIALVGKSAGNAFFEIAAASFVDAIESEGGTVEVVYPETATADAQIRVLDNLINQEIAQMILSQAGFMVNRRRLPTDETNGEDIEIKALDAEAEEARLYLMEQGL